MTAFDFLMICLMIAASAAAAADKHPHPHNVVGVVSKEVVLECNRNVTGEVDWTYAAPGSTDETSIPGRYRKETTSYGLHRLILEELKLPDAGTYVCRSRTTPAAFTGAGAYVVVVAHPPHCLSNLASNQTPSDGMMVEFTCWMTYSGVSNVLLNMTWSDADGRMIKTAAYNTTTTGLSAHDLRVGVRARPPYILPHVCHATFHTHATTYSDMAANSPVLDDGECRSPDRPIAVSADGYVANELTAVPVPAPSGHSSSGVPLTNTEKENPPAGSHVVLWVVMVVILVLIFIVMLVFVVHWVYCKHRRWSPSGGVDGATSCSKRLVDNGPCRSPSFEAGGVHYRNASCTAAEGGDCLLNAPHRLLDVATQYSRQCSEATKEHPSNERKPDQCLDHGIPENGVPDGSDLQPQVIVSPKGQSAQFHYCSPVTEEQATGSERPMVDLVVDIHQLVGEAGESSTSLGSPERSTIGSSRDRLTLVPCPDSVQSCVSDSTPREVVLHGDSDPGSGAGDQRAGSSGDVEDEVDSGNVDEQTPLTVLEGNANE